MNLRNRLPFYISLVQKGLEWFGYPLICTRAKAKALKNLTLWGKSVQNGTPTPTNPVEIESVGDKQLLPYGYTQLEYIESTGTQCIIIPERQYVSGEELEIDFAYMSFIGAYPTVYGSHLSEIYTNNTGVVSSFGNIQISEPQRFILNQKQTIKAKISSSITVSQCLFAYMQTTGTPNYMAIGRLYKFIDRLNGVDVFNMIPAKRNSDGVVGMYDTVSNTFFTNTGTGEFIAGNVVGQGGYKIPVEVATKGQNIFNKDKALIGYTINAQGVITPSDAYNCSNYVFVEYGKTYIRLNNTSPLGATYHLFNADKVWLGSKVAPGGDGTMVIDNADCKYIAVAIAKTVSLDTYQIIEGTTPKPYMPYQYTTTNIYLNEPLRKIGDYTDTMSVDGTTVTVTRNVKSEELGTTGWAYQSQYTRFVREFSSFTKSKGVRLTPLLADCFIKCDDGRPYTSVPDNSVYSGSEYYNIYFVAHAYNTVEDFTNALKDTTVAYPLATPTTETYTIPEAITLPGECVITTDTTVSPSDMYGKQ